eukprot:854574-Pelagomonas_calceolata.AAC.3
MPEGCKHMRADVFKGIPLSLVEAHEKDGIIYESRVEGNSPRSIVCGCISIVYKPEHVCAVQEANHFTAVKLKVLSFFE